MHQLKKKLVPFKTAV